MRRFLAAHPVTAALLLGVLTLAWRAVLDKLLAARGGPELVATWAQLQSIGELVSGVALAAIAPGVSVLVAQAREEEHAAVVGEGARIAWRIAAIALVAVGVLLALPLGAFALAAHPAVAIGAALVGFAACGAGIVTAYWTARERRDLLLAWSACAGACVIGGAWLAPDAMLTTGLVIAYALPNVAIAAALVLWLHRSDADTDAGAQAQAQASRQTHRRAIAQFILPSLSIGLLSPLSLIAVRTVTAEAMSVADVGVMQAIWRSAEWITHLSATVIAVVFFPRLAAAGDARAFHAVLRRAMLVVLAPAAAGFLVIGLAQERVLMTLYSASFIASDRAVALFFAAEWLRLGSWLYLYALYAVRGTTAAAAGELLSLPLFAAAVFALRDALDLEVVAAVYLASFTAYLAFNYWAVERRFRRSARA